MVGFEYAQFGKTFTEQTSPTVDQLPTYINTTLWSAGPSVTISNNSVDYYNYSVYVAALGTEPTDPTGYYNLFGNGSLEINGTNTNNVTAETSSDAFNVNCGSNGFQNLSMAIKLATPQSVPQSATITLYSLNDSNSYTLDLTSIVIKHICSQTYGKT